MPAKFGVRLGDAEFEKDGDADGEAVAAAVPDGVPPIVEDAVGVPEGLPLRLTLGDGDVDSAVVRVEVGEEVGLPATDGVTELVVWAEGVAVTVLPTDCAAPTEGVTEGEGAVGLADTVGDTAVLPLALPVGLTVPGMLSVALREADAPFDRLDVGLTVGEAAIETEDVADTEEESEDVAVAVADRVPVALGVALGVETAVPVPVGENEAVTVPVIVASGDAAAPGERLGEDDGAEMVGEAVRVAVIDTDRVADRVADTEDVADAVDDTDDVDEAVRDTDMVELAVAVAVDEAPRDRDAESEGVGDTRPAGGRAEQSAASEGPRTREGNGLGV
jgi:hypothetical protein